MEKRCDPEVYGAGNGGRGLANQFSACDVVASSFNQSNQDARRGE